MKKTESKRGYESPHDVRDESEGCHTCNNYPCQKDTTLLCLSAEECGDYVKRYRFYKQIDVRDYNPILQKIKKKGLLLPGCAMDSVNEICDRAELKIRDEIISKQDELIESAKICIRAIKCKNLETASQLVNKLETIEKELATLRGKTETKG